MFVCLKKPIELTYGAYGTSPKNPAIIVANPVKEKVFAYCLEVAISPYKSSDPFKAAKVFDKFKSPAKTIVKTIPVFQIGLPKGKKLKLSYFAVSLVSFLKIRT